MDAWLRVDSLWEFDCPELLSRKACDILLSVRMQSPKSGGKIDVRKQGRDIKEGVEGPCSSNN